jgi:hypothetical protein
MGHMDVTYALPRGNAYSARAASLRAGRAALSSPPDMGWFPASMAAQGRSDLTAEVMLERR